MFDMFTQMLGKTVKAHAAPAIQHLINHNSHFSVLIDHSNSLVFTILSKSWNNEFYRMKLLGTDAILSYPCDAVGWLDEYIPNYNKYWNCLNE